MYDKQKKISIVLMALAGLMILRGIGWVKFDFNLSPDSMGFWILVGFVVVVLWILSGNDIRWGD